MKSVREEAEATFIKASDEMKHFADFRRGDGPTLKVGDKVYVDASDYTQIILQRNSAINESVLISFSKSSMTMPSN